MLPLLSPTFSLLLSCVTRMYVSYWLMSEVLSSVVPIPSISPFICAILRHIPCFSKACKSQQDIRNNTQLHIYLYVFKSLSFSTFISSVCFVMAQCHVVVIGLYVRVYISVEGVTGQFFFWLIKVWRPGSAHDNFLLEQELLLFLREYWYPKYPCLCLYSLGLSKQY